MTNEDAAKWLLELAAYFEKRPTGGEDMAHWANAANAATARKIAAIAAAPQATDPREDTTDFCGADPFENGYTPAAVEKMYRDRLTAAQAENEKLKARCEAAEAELAKTRCPIGLDEAPHYCSATGCFQCLRSDIFSVANERNAAQAENRQLRAELAQCRKSAEVTEISHDGLMDEVEKLRRALDAAAMYARARSECYGSSPMGTYAEGHKDASSILLAQIEAIIATLSPSPLSPEKE